MPVAASTISLLMLSLDRFATVKHPRLAQLRQRRFLPYVLAFGSWASAIIVSVPILISYRIAIAIQHTDLSVETSISKKNHLILSTTSITSTITSPTIITDTILQNNYTITDDLTAICRPAFDSSHSQTIFFSLYIFFVFILPGVGVILNHLGVRQKLCALSLTARAAHGELPLPMPILRRPTHMIIVTGMANAAAVRDDDDSSNEDNNQQKDERRHMMDSTKLKTTPRTPR